ncbi:hypothetical protein GCM10009579_58640 [Streptomyces javensis]|uniref:Transposase IS701-like DDE domain-containing protein n=1 Tax=Streptomyces javensis TaxID=114698 RepID=A0ABN1X9K4_9ACTN
MIDDTSFPKAGDQSVGAARKRCGALGKKPLCQVGVSLHAVTDAASIPVTWRLFLPAEGADPFDGRRSKAGAPQDAGHREKWRLALDTIDEARGRGLDGRVAVADTGYGQIHSFPSGLAERGLDYMTAVRGDTSAHPGDAAPTAPEREGPMDAPRLPHYREPARSLKDLVMTAGRRRLRRITWQQGSKGTMSGRFMMMDIRPADAAATKTARDPARGRTAWDGALPVETLIAEWPPGQSEPTDNWLTSPPADTALRHLARMTKIRCRIKHDHRELKHSPRAGPLREPYLTRMVSPHHPPHRHPHLPHPPDTEPKSPSAGLTIYQVLHPMQELLLCWAGACPTRHRNPPVPPGTNPPPSTTQRSTTRGACGGRGHRRPSDQCRRGTGVVGRGGRSR